ncbi:hypothetical protein [Carboxylicivirga sp. M1479]|uniref:hypothetical protein n=1 Tax=Carboxylicivirga sp. M1479 TaxID=2594476 RepID=UPI001178C2FA|nr:hypothetical protein [Carboxylicivirga sp. M1479]TRX66161.1 hypothetical protein FNN09_14680 [Carboxylicivirga sp. M1479]
MNITQHQTILHKAFILMLFLMCSQQQASSQSINSNQAASPTHFLGLGAGINDYGLGIGSEVKAYKNCWVYGNAGISTWGYRLTGGINFYSSAIGYKSSFSLGYSYALGIDDFEPTLEVHKYRFSAFQEYIETEVLMDLHPIGTINFIYSYNLKVGMKSKFVFSGGYSLILTNDIYENKSIYELTEKSKDFIDIMAPGGVIVGVKFMI